LLLATPHSEQLRSEPLYRCLVGWYPPSRGGQKQLLLGTPHLGVQGGGGSKDLEYESPRRARRPPARGLARRMYRSNTRDEHEGAGALTRASGAPHELRAVAPGAPWRPLRAARARQEAPRRVIVATSTRSGACSQWVLRRRTTPGAMQQPSVVPYSKASECGYRTRSKCAVGVIGVMEVRVTDFTAPNPLRVR
jgi:hypothetical protein